MPLVPGTSALQSWRYLAASRTFPQQDRNESEADGTAAVMSITTREVRNQGLPFVCQDACFHRSRLLSGVYSLLV